MSSKSLFKVKRTLETLCQSSKYASASVRRNSGWTSDRIVKSPFKNVDLPNITLNEYIFQNLDKWPERTAAVCAVTGRGYTYEQTFKLSNAFAANLRNKFKIEDGDVVSVMLPNIPDFPLVALGILEAGGVVSTINPIYTAHEVQRQLLLSNAKIVVTLPEIVPVIKSAFNIAKIDLPVIVIRTNGDELPDGTIIFNELTEDPRVDTSCLKAVRRSTNDICFLPYSSGTTGLPKGVELSHKNIIANCEQINEPLIRCHNDTTDSHQDAVMGILPFFHIYGASVIMFHKMSAGAKLVTLAKFQPDVFLQSLQKSRTNILFLAPPILLLMSSHPAASKAVYQYLDVVISGAAPCAASDVRRLCEKVQRKLDYRQGYGLTETSPVVCFPKNGSDEFAAVGHPVPSTELKIVDNDLKSLGPNETGELLIKGPQVMRGYKDNPQANIESFTADGWFRSGDLATIDDRGVVTIADRLKELIKVKGFQVPPAELEGVLRDHPAVNDAAVIGVPHPHNGEAPKAFVVLKPGQKADTQNICAFVNERVAPYKNIKDVVFLDSIPKSSAGKILRKDLKAQYCS
ncbi:uncharacterized protein pdgy isoform X2 [Plodia interpunctella]|uniref:uncharacterized protein pdgy isoform X2 n=1 Tax=Plodia interpunctella TaxID=58824 RepID=UPI002368CE07|nr:uncharacterized protein LOC128674408 isoform X2 [Plodia interpunctella]